MVDSCLNPSIPLLGMGKRLSGYNSRWPQLLEARPSGFVFRFVLRALGGFGGAG
jgi:hypothetical protein